MDDEISLTQHTIELARDLLREIELGQSTGEQFVRKAFRLARLLDDVETLGWLRHELYGYSGQSEMVMRYMGLTGRWTNKEERQGWWGGLAQIEATIAAQENKMRSLRLPDVAADMAFPIMNSIRQDLAATSNVIAQLSGVRSKVIALLHLFATKAYYEFGI